MNRMTRLKQAALMVAVSGLAAAGCAGTNRPGVQARYDDFVDPNWPLRYSYQARESTLHPFETQVRNANITEATIGNYQFVPGTDKLTEDGKAKLDYLARRGQCADGHLFLQTARDVAFDPANPGEIVAKRAELDSKRSQAVLAYMGSQPGGKVYDVTPIDPRDTTMSAVGPATAVRGLPDQFRSGITGAAGLPLTGVGGGPGAGAPGVPTSGSAGGAAGGTGGEAAPSGGGATPSSGGTSAAPGGR